MINGKSLGEDGSYTKGLMLCEGMVQARDDHTPQTNIEPILYYYLIGVSEPMDIT